MTKAPISYYGSKSRLVSDIIAEFPAHRTYVEPFGGSAIILLNKVRAHTEILNDRDDALVNLYRVMRLDHARLVKELRLTPYSRAEHASCCQRLKQDSLKGDLLEWARVYYVAVCQSYGGIVGDSFSTSATKGPATTWCRRIDERLAIVANRLREVTIECRPAIDIIERYDGPHSLIYCDPPYHLDTRTASARASGKYRHEMTGTEHEHLLRVITKAKGKVLLSGFDHPLYTRMLKGWRVCWRKRLHMVCSTTVKHAAAKFRNEILWANF